MDLLASEKNDIKMKTITHTTAELSALFPPETAGRDMVSEIPIFLEDASVSDVRKHLLKDASQYNTLNYLYAVDKEHHLKGVVSIKELLQSNGRKPLKKIMQKNIIASNPLDTVPHVALLALQHNLKMVPIVDHKNRLVGAFSSQKLLDILNREFSNDLLRLSGIAVPRRHFHFKQLKIVSSRLPWMMVGMIGGLLTGLIIGAFRSSIEAIVLLAVFIPVIMSTGATSANQSAMIFLRNLIHGDIKGWGKYTLNEIKISAVLGLILGGVLFIILSAFPGDKILAAAVSISLFFTIIAGALVGVITPMVLNRLKLDPSIGAGPFLTIVKDLIAMTIYFTVATSFLTYFAG